MKSKLFVPGSRPELFPKALASQADGLSFDLEDAVARDAKPRARAHLQELLQSGATRESGKIIVVRVNAFDTPYFIDDVRAVVRNGVDMINLPKPDSPEQIRQVLAEITSAEANNRVDRPIKLLLNIETPRSLRIAYELASADLRVVGLQLGMVDLFEPNDIDRSNKSIVQHVMLAVKMAASEAGIFAYDSSFADIQDPEGFRAEAAFSHGLGYLGKSCIHPSQIALANATFRPTDAQIAYALKVVEAAEIAERNGVGAYKVDGKMVDVPIVIRARAIVAAASASGLLNNDTVDEEVAK
jgi:citrate lyase subunit beta / citryl-CoA lyase